MKTTLILSIAILLLACQNNKYEYTNKNILPLSSNEWEFNVDFPVEDSDIIKTTRTNPEFPESNVINWTIDGNEDDEYYIYFVAHDAISDDMRNSVKLFENGYYEMLEAILEGGIKNYDGVNVRYNIIENDSLYILDAKASYFGNKDFGEINYRGYTNGYQLIIIGAVGMEKLKSQKIKFFNSLEIWNK